MDNTKGKGLDAIIRSTDDGNSDSSTAGRKAQTPDTKKKNKLEQTSQFSVRLYSEQYTYLQELIHHIKHARQPSKSNERITMSTFLRVGLSLLKDLEVDLTDITCEEILEERIRDAARRYP